MTDDEIVLWLITKGTMEDKPIMRLAADRLIQMAQAVREHDDDLVERLRGIIVQLSAERDRLHVSNMQMLGDIAVSMGRIEALTAERERLRKALEDIIADCQADYPPSHGAIKYAAKLALKGEAK